MKRTCDCCNGTGECPECNGVGEWDCPIEKVKLSPWDRHYKELSAFQQDIKRLRSQALRLEVLLPHCKEKIWSQLDECVRSVEKLAEKVS